MRKIIVTVSPFVLKQNVQVYEDGNKLEIVEPKLEEVMDTVFGLVEKYSARNVTLIGPKQYNNGLKKRMKEHEKFVKYNVTNNLTITVVS